MILKPTKEHITHCAEVLRQGSLVSFPTETVYGIGANASDENAVKKIYDVKGRPSFNPLIVHIAHVEDVSTVASFTSKKQEMLFFQLSEHFWPGPLTIVVPKTSNIPEITSGGLSSVGIRIPRHEIALRLLQACGFPLAAPSANRSNYVSPTTAIHVEESFPEIPILDGGDCTVGLESTIISILDVEKLKILRHGGIPKEKLEAILKTSIHEKTTSEIEAPGNLKVHYAPKTPLQFLNNVDIWSLPLQKIGFIGFSEHQHLDFDFHAIEILSGRGNLEAVAKRLFSALRTMDNLKLDLILIDSCLESGIGKAIMDRLKRATSLVR